MDWSSNIWGCDINLAYQFCHCIWVLCSQDLETAMHTGSDVHKVKLEQGVYMYTNQWLCHNAKSLPARFVTPGGYRIFSNKTDDPI